jgi:hypothetical protein
MTRASAFVLGYHGCDKAVGEKVLANQEHLRSSDNNYDWLMREAEGELPFDTVRAAFIEGPPLYENAGFHEQTHIQICVRGPQQIMGYFRPIGVG